MKIKKNYTTVVETLIEISIVVSSNPDLGLTLSAPTALTNSVEPLCLATA